MWEKLDKLNKQLKDIKQHERAEENKMSSTILKDQKIVLRVIC